MKIRAAILITCGMIAAVHTAKANVRKSVRLSLQTRPVIVENGQSFKAIFADEPVIATVALNFVRYPDAPGTPPGSFTGWRLPSRAWWTALQWNLTGPSGRETAVGAPKLIREVILNGAKNNVKAAPNEPYSLAENQRPSADLNLGQLPVGDYVLTVRFGGIASNSVQFAVRRGDESIPVRRAHLRAQMQRPMNFSQARVVLLDLAKLEPENAGIFEQLGALSLDHTPLDETLGYYDRAAEIVQQRARRTSPEAHARNSEISRAVERELNRIAQVKEALLTYGANRKELKVVIIGTLSQSIVQVVRRDTGAIVRSVQ